MSSWKIGELNDAFRQDPQVLGKVVATRGVAVEGALFVFNALQCVRFYNDFTLANDPHGERNFGIFELEGEKLCFKIDYYDRDCICTSEDPGDPSKTTRILTIMIAKED